MKSKVLIVDDQADVRELLRSVLEDNYDVAQAASGAALQKCFPQDPPDVVLLDVKLPDADGLDLLPLVKQHEVLAKLGVGEAQLLNDWKVWLLGR